MTMQVRIEREVCTGAGDCARAVPELFMMADDGLAMLHQGGEPLGEDADGFTPWIEVPATLETTVQQAADGCPGTCIVVEYAAASEPASSPEPEPEAEPATEPAPEPEAEPASAPVAATAVAASPRSSMPTRIAFRLRRLFSSST